MAGLNVNLGAAEQQQVGVFRDDDISDSLPVQVGELRVCFVRSDDTVHADRPTRLERIENSLKYPQKDL